MDTLLGVGVLHPGWMHGHRDGHITGAWGYFIQDICFVIGMDTLLGVGVLHLGWMRSHRDGHITGGGGITSRMDA